MINIGLHAARAVPGPRRDRTGPAAGRLTERRSGPVRLGPAPVAHACGQASGGTRRRQHVPDRPHGTASPLHPAPHKSILLRTTQYCSVPAQYCSVPVQYCSVQISTDQYGSALLSTAQYRPVRLSTAQYRLSTAQHCSVPLSTGSVPLSTDQYRLSTAQYGSVLAQYGSVPLSTDQYRSVRLSTAQYWLSTDQYRSVSLSTAQYGSVPAQYCSVLSTGSVQISTGSVRLSTDQYCSVPSSTAQYEPYTPRGTECVTRVTHPRSVCSLLTRTRTQVAPTLVRRSVFCLSGAARAPGSPPAPSAAASSRHWPGPVSGTAAASVSCRVSAVCSLSATPPAA